MGSLVARANMRGILNIAGFWFGTYVILEFWQWLELHMYGEIQERSVDTVITVLWMAFVLIAYFKGHSDGHMDIDNERRSGGSN